MASESEIIKKPEIIPFRRGHKPILMNKYYLLFTLLIFVFSCDNTDQSKKVDRKKNTYETLFSLIPSSKSNVKFSNKIKETLEFNFLNYPYIYIGAGVSIGDINNDGLQDIYFTSNQNSNKLYLNKGDFKFEDITNSAGLKDDNGWSSGANMIDINNDGWLDIYVCKSASLNSGSLRANKLFINQKDNTFKENAAEWNLADQGFSVQSYFLDYDKDGDLDMYLVNHRFDFKNNNRISSEIQNNITNETSDQLYRNDGNQFTNVTAEAGVLNKAWGLSASIGDFNNDGWSDIYVANDYLEPDILYINNQDGTFTNKVLSTVNHISFASMGSDFADINNDLLPDLVVLEMTPSDHIRSKTNMASMSTSNFMSMVDIGYHHQYMSNVLQLNNGNYRFSEIALMAGIAKTDWSWAPLFADFDNDGYKDLYITNGIVKDMGNQDFRINLSKRNAQNEVMTLDSVLAMIPEERISNYVFKNNTDLTFKNTVKAWGMDQPSYSNGAAYADLDNDGDLDLIVNNFLDESFIYRNNSDKNFLQIKLKGFVSNSLALGSKVTVTTGDNKQYQELYMSRGYESSVQNILHFGLNDVVIVDHIKVEWPDGKSTILTGIEANQIVELDYNSAEKIEKTSASNNKVAYLDQIDPKELGIDYKHEENDFYDFKDQILLPYSQSKNGPFIATADVNSDGTEDFFVGGANGQSGQLYIQNEGGKFELKNSADWENDKSYEDLGVLFFDYDGDSDQDLYVVSGGAEYPVGSEMYQDRLYVNDGKGNFKKSKNALPKINSSGQTVVANDIDSDGDIDLFIGGRVIPDKYPYSPKSHLLINENGKFVDKTSSLAPELSEAGLITSAIFSDFDNDNDDDLVVIGEWTPIQIFENTGGEFKKLNSDDLNNTVGMWFSLSQIDIDNDGDLDYFAGNLGLNAKFKANSKKEFHIFCDDFDNSGTYDIVLSNTYKGSLVPSRGRECSSQQMAFIEEKFPTYQSFAEADITDIYGQDDLDGALHYQADLLYSVLLENKGNGQFEIKKLPNEAQIAPIMSFDFVDINNDGILEILAVGNLYNTEVETVRYDASYGTVLNYANGKFEVKSPLATGLNTTGDSKDATLLNQKDGKSYYVVTNNDSNLDVFMLEGQ